MKKTIFAILFFFTSALLFAASVLSLQSDSRPATVEKQHGIFVFWECTPTDDYQLIGYVKEGMGSSSATARKMRFIKRAKENYPNADGIIYNPDIMGHTKAQVIKFKE